ncbi:sialidase-3.1 isoform X1 [Ctenopharyngodon idella]|uniref:sialidase-3.1 isoform X1 n=1 Tax=Ctenopharyngodon idella TaxID=7959 RepID=UPI002232C29B|nr:sialidase-3.1 isoform X1 [Ctenopharyngodon idella]XP_051733376.1 sialidase-3.1 isoform X1 [Ctenopharyngodon idella]
MTDSMASKSYPKPQQALPARTALFQQRDGKTYRIPALIYISDGQTFLAFAEKRNSPRDSDAKVLVMRRGSLQNGSLQWSPVQILSSACLENHRTMNPCPVYESKSKTIYLFFVCISGETTECHQISTGRNQARLCYITSTDYGQNWSKLTDLTDSVIGDEICNWATFAVGPGHGIQMKSGRLIIPAYAYYIHCRCFPFHFPLIVRPHALSFYSDDCGVTWQMGGKIQMKSCECEMAEIIDHADRSHLYCNARSTRGHRVEALSESSGAAFDNPHVAKKLVEPHHGCQGSVLSFPVPEPSEEEEKKPSDCLTQLDTKTWLLYSHPTNKKKRRDLGVYLSKSPLNFSGWGRPWIIHKGPSGYSDLTQCEERFACLMECGEKSEIEEIAFVEFKLSDVLCT